jgi:hypothetical protein
MNIVKYINPYTLLSPASLLTDYVNLNIFGNPVQMQYIAVIVYILSILSLVLMLLHRQDTGEQKKSYIKLPEATLIVKYFRKPRIKSVRLFLHENWRLYIGSYVWIILGALVIFQAFRADLTRPRILPEEVEYRAVIEYMQTLSTEEQKKWINEEKQNTAGSAGPRASALHRASDQLLYLEEQTSGELVYETGWLVVTGKPGRSDNLINSLILYICLIPVALLVREKELSLLILSTVRGRKMLTIAKLMTILGISVLIFAISYGFTFWGVINIFGLDSPCSMSLSISAFSNIEQPLWLLLLSFYCIRLVTAYISCIGIYFLSRFGIHFALAAGLILFVLPMLFWLMVI